jgi:hypothetical protein
MANEFNESTFLDDQTCNFGTSKDFKVVYDSADNRLEIRDTSDTVIATMTTAGALGVSNVLGTTYTPTLTDVANAGTLDLLVARYTRVASVVTVAATFRAAITATATLTQVRVTLPVASNFANLRECSGAGATDDSTGANIVPVSVVADPTNDAILLSFTPETASSLFVSFTATYVII